MKQTFLIVGTLLIYAVGNGSADVVPSFQPLGVLPGYETSGARAVTPDASTVVGSCTKYSPWEFEATRWTVDGGMVGLGDLPEGAFQSRARAVSDDGGVIVGYGTHVSDRHHAFRWTEAEGMVDLGDFPGGTDNSEAWDVSADGNIIVGFGRREYASEAFRWTAEDGMVGLGYVSGYSSSWAHAISSDGTTIVGAGENGYGSRQAFRWTTEAGMVGLGDLPGGAWPLDSIAIGVSADGGIIVGRGESVDGFEAMRWTEEDGMIGLGDLPGGDFYSVAVGATTDGSMIVGAGTTDRGGEAFLWDEQHGLRRMQDVLEDDYGLELTGWRLIGANISDDGQFIIGSAENPEGYHEAFLARIPEPQTLSLAMVAVLVLGALGRRYR